MEEGSDLYGILGVLPTAEVVVIRAAYRALAQQYHPDKFSGDKDEAHRRMSELNLAYSVLKDKGQRDEYDSKRRSSNQSRESYFTEHTNETPPQYDPLEEDWRIASKFFQDLPEIEGNLAKVSWRLAYSFRALMLEEKDFEKRAAVAKNLEAQFFEFHFGKDRSVIDVARHLILKGEREKAAELSKAVGVLGEKVDSSRILSAFRPPPPSIKEKPGPTWQDQEAMDTHGIRYDGELFHYGGYIYQQLENAVTYAKACEGRKK